MPARTPTDSPRPCRVAVFQEGGSGARKVAGIRAHGRDIEVVADVDVAGPLPEFIDEPEAVLPRLPEADVVLCFLRHPDLADFVVRHYAARGTPVVASGPRPVEGADSPFTCCSLPRRPALGAYGEQFGLPEFEVRLEAGRIAEVRVRRGASCGATWEAARRLAGLAPEAALAAVGREVQYLCCADPSAFDPVSGKSPLHHAGHVHRAALRKALERAGAPGRPGDDGRG
ncbi:DUF166 family (seleno)protein DfsP [Dissulfurirhabdus thermomarina]|nr:DUF166 family (seleno)protein DfsP [Dissulfurirhabdus thermomarina]